jgi:hypothetical protein
LKRLALVALMLVGAVGAGSSAAVDVHADPRGDSGSAPDIVSVRLANDVVARAIEFAVVYANAGGERGTMWVETDDDSSTGSPGRGGDYRITWEDPFQFTLERWDPRAAAFAAFMPDAMVGSVSSGQPAEAWFSIPEEDLGTPRKVAVAVSVERGGSSDQAPNTGFWAYDVDRRPLRLTVTRTRFASTPRTGRPFTLSVVVMRSDLGEELVGGAVGCAASIGTTRLRGRRDPLEARCTWSIPRTARGRTLRATIVVRFAGARASKTVRLRIR